MDDWDCCQPSASCSISFKRWGEKGYLGDSVVIFERARTSISQQHHIQLTFRAGKICPSVAWGEGWIFILFQYTFLSWKGNHICNFIQSLMHTPAPKLITFGSGFNMFQERVECLVVSLSRGCFVFCVYASNQKFFLFPVRLHELWSAYAIIFPLSTCLIQA